MAGALRGGAIQSPHSGLLMCFRWRLEHPPVKRRSVLEVGLITVTAMSIAAFVVYIAVDRFNPPAISITTLTPESIAVEVSGAVATPGVVTVPDGARLIDVVNAAGGLLDTADLSRINLAGRVRDGDRVVIPALLVDSTIDVDASSASPVPANNGLVNLNTATIEELDTLPGIGPAIAQRIIDFREFYGPFTSIDQLAQVEGISPAMVERLRPLVTVRVEG